MADEQDTTAKTETATADTTAKTATDTTAAKAADKTAATTTEQAKTDATAETVAATWRDDWRDALIAKLPEAEREKELARLKRFTSPENVFKSLRELEKRVSAGMLKPTLPEGASEAEIAEYRKASGIPEKAEAEAYGIKFPEGYEVTDADKADVTDFLTDMHKDNVPPAVVQKVWGKYLAIKEKAEQQLYEAAQQQTINQKAELKAEWGRDYDRNVRLGNAHLVQALGEEQAKAWMAITLADGTKLGDHPITARYITAQAMALADDASLATSEFGDSGKSYEDQYKAALALRTTDPKTYHSAAHQEKLMKLGELKAKQQAKKAA